MDTHVLYLSLWHNYSENLLIIQKQIINYSGKQFGSESVKRLLKVYGEFWVIFRQIYP